MTVSKTKSYARKYYLLSSHLASNLSCRNFTYPLSVPLTILSIYYQIRIPQLLIKAFSVEIRYKRRCLPSCMFSYYDYLQDADGNPNKAHDARISTDDVAFCTRTTRFSMPYQQLISADVQNQIVKLESITTRGGDGGPIHFRVNFSGFLIALTGMQYSPEIVHINPCFFL